jgi:hypothetical protein
MSCIEGKTSQQCIFKTATSLAQYDLQSFPFLTGLFNEKMTDFLANGVFDGAAPRTAAPCDP